MPSVVVWAIILLVFILIFLFVWKLLRFFFKAVLAVFAGLITLVVISGLYFTLSTGSFKAGWREMKGKACGFFRPHVEKAKEAAKEKVKEEGKKMLWESLKKK